jgi:hypothetical protein
MGSSYAVVAVTICEHTSILRALVEYPQGNLGEIQEKTLWSTQEEPGGRQDRKAQAYATERYTASRTASAKGERTYVRTLGQVGLVTTQCHV